MYSGGSIVADILSRDDETLRSVALFAAVRGQEQVDQISKIGVKAMLIDLNDKSAVEDAIIQNNSKLLVTPCL
jgi:saccharopine dehydrogenase-like NADP-dependent oxidoreductase